MPSIRYSTLVLVLVSLTPLTALAQRCDTATLADTVCDCGCTVSDSACPSGGFIGCTVNHCPAGQVPWESTPSACMTSACGDGWKDPVAGEVCDDGNALANGGCSADCRSVNPGYACGEGARGCRVAPVDAGAPQDAGTQPTDAGSPAGQSDAGPGASADAGAGGSRPPGGCSTVPGSLLSLVATLLALRRRR